jgi:WD40 repeat protein
MVSYCSNRVHILFIDQCFTVVGDRLVTVNKSGDIEVRLVHTGQVVHTIRTGDGRSCINLIMPVPDHSELLVTGHYNGAVHLWDIGNKGARACECMNVKAGVHVRRIVQFANSVDKIVASSTRLLCSYHDTLQYSMKVAIVYFDDERSS